MTEPQSTSLARVSMSLPAELSRQLDAMVEERALPSRSQLIAELIRNELAEHGAAAHPEGTLAGRLRWFTAVTWAGCAISLPKPRRNI